LRTALHPERTENLRRARLDRDGCGRVRRRLRYGDRSCLAHHRGRQPAPDPSDVRRADPAGGARGPDLLWPCPARISGPPEMARERRTERNIVLLSNVKSNISHEISVLT